MTLRVELDESFKLDYGFVYGPVEVLGEGEKGPML